MLGCFSMILISAAVIGGGAWYAASRVPEWSRDAVAEIVHGSPLTEEDKEQLIAQIDRVLLAYQDGQMDLEQLMELSEHVVRSPVFGAIVAEAAEDKYIAQSGLSDRERAAGRLQLRRVVQGVYEQRITPEQLGPVLDYISRPDPSGQRQLIAYLDDDQLRAWIDECRRVADQAGVGPGGLNLDIGDEIERLVNAQLNGQLN